MNRRDQIETVEVGRGDLESRTESLFRGWTVNDGGRRASRMIVSGRDSGIEMVAFEMMIGITLMAETCLQRMSSSSINDKEAKQNKGQSFHNNS